MRLRKLRHILNPRLTAFEFYALGVMIVIVGVLTLIALSMQIYETFRD